KDGNKSAKLSVLKIDDDARLYQRVSVKPATKYKLTGWVKCKDVNIVQPGGTIGACLCIDYISAGNDLKTQSLKGSHDWTPLIVEFDSGSRNSIDVEVRLGWYGSTCRGTAWFDGLELIEAR